MQKSHLGTGVETKTAPSQSIQLADLGFNLCQFRRDDEVKSQQRKYVALFAAAPGPVLDIGCGRGIMLELLKLGGIEAYGLDTFPAAIDECERKGLSAIHAELFSHLAQLADSSLGGVFCSHVIEHLVPADAIVLLREVHRVLRPGGKLILLTPNCRDLMVALDGFWLDLSHVRFYPARLLQSILTQLGFRTVALSEDKDTRYGRTFYRRAAAMIRKLWFWGLMNRGDVVAVATK